MEVAGPSYELPTNGRRCCAAMRSTLSGPNGCCRRSVFRIWAAALHFTIALEGQLRRERDFLHSRRRLIPPGDDAWPRTL